MKLFRLATTLGAMIGLALASVYFAATASAQFVVNGHDTGALLLPPPPVASATASTSTWWFALVAVGAAAVTVVVMVTVRALRAHRMLPTTS
jgi:hypothetical protein